MGGQRKAIKGKKFPPNKPCKEKEDHKNKQYTKYNRKVGAFILYVELHRNIYKCG